MINQFEPAAAFLNRVFDVMGRMVKEFQLRQAKLFLRQHVEGEAIQLRRLAAI